MGDKWGLGPRWREHVISVHGQTPTSAKDFDHLAEHQREDWGHDVLDLFTWEHEGGPMKDFRRDAR